MYGIPCTTCTRKDIAESAKVKNSTMKLAVASVVALATSASAFVANPAPNGVASTTQLFERKPFITGNWKLNPKTKNEAMALAQDIAATLKPTPTSDIGLFVPFPFIEMVQTIVGDKITVGAEVRFSPSSFQRIIWNVKTFFKANLGIWLNLDRW